MPTSVNEQNIAVLHIRAFLDVFRSEEAHIIEHVAQIYDHARAIAPLDGNLINCLAFSHKMTWRVEMRTHMVRRLDVLGIDSMLRFALDVLHFKRRIKRPE